MKQTFTLMELIVVTILAISSTIGFISINSDRDRNIERDRNIDRDRNIEKYSSLSYDEELCIEKCIEVFTISYSYRDDCKKECLIIK